MSKKDVKQITEKPLKYMEKHGFDKTFNELDKDMQKAHDELPKKEREHLDKVRKDFFKKG